MSRALWFCLAGFFLLFAVMFYFRNDRPGLPGPTSPPEAQAPIKVTQGEHLIDQPGMVPRINCGEAKSLPNNGKELDLTGCRGTTRVGIILPPMLEHSAHRY